jgi:hypothetical protein
LLIEITCEQVVRAGERLVVPKRSANAMHAWPANALLPLKTLVVPVLFRRKSHLRLRKPLYFETILLAVSWRLLVRPAPAFLNRPLLLASRLIRAAKLLDDPRQA